MQRVSNVQELWCYLYGGVCHELDRMQEKQLLLLWEQQNLHEQCFEVLNDIGNISIT